MCTIYYLYSDLAIYGIVERRLCIVRPLAGVNDGLMVCCQVIGLYGVVYDARMIVMIVMCCQV